MRIWEEASWKRKELHLNRWMIIFYCFLLIFRKSSNQSEALKESAPDAKEKISYGIPTFVLHGNLVHFAAYKRHIGFYSGANGIEAFKNELAEYKWSKGAVQFPVDKQLPYELIKEIVEFRVAENMKISEIKPRNKNK